MKIEDFRQFSTRLAAAAQEHEAVRALILVGSSAMTERQPDAYSDHDFFLVTTDGQQEAFRQDVGWLPDADHIVLTLRETEHGLFVLYDWPHVLEFAVFDEAEFLQYARLNAYKVYVDKGDFGAAAARIASANTLHPPERNAAHHFGKFVQHMMVGAGRFRRGEVLSAHAHIKDWGLTALLHLLHEYLPAPHPEAIDKLDVYRRFSMAYPEIGHALQALLVQNPLQAAQGMLRLAAQHLSEAETYPAAAIAVASAYCK